MKTQYTVVITKKETVRKKSHRVWETLETKEVPREHNFYSDDPKEPKTRIEQVRGWTPEIEQDEEVETKVLEQTVDSLDLSKVIKAINNLN